MAKGEKLASAAGRPPKKWTLTEPEGVLAVYADVFTVATENEAGVITLSFYQSNTGSPGGAITQGTHRLRAGEGAALISRVVISNKGLGALMDALRNNQQTADGLPETEKAS